jgi:cell division protein FtsZ
LIIIDNNKLIRLMPKLPMNDAFAVVDNLIAEIINGITETISEPSLINLDFADVKAIMGRGGVATMLFGEGTTKNTDKIIKDSLKNPLLETNFAGAVGALIHIVGGKKLSLKMVQEITAGITYKLDKHANIIMGASVRPEMGDKVKVLTIMTGLKPPKILCPIDDELRDNIREQMPRPDFSQAMSYIDLEKLDKYR